MDFLKNDLFCRLRSDSRKIFGNELLGKHVAHFCALFDEARVFKRYFAFLRFFSLYHGMRKEKTDRTLFGADVNLYDARFALELFFIGGSECARKRVDKRIFADSFFPFQVGKSRKKVFVNHISSN